MTYQVEIALGSLPLLREQGATEGRPLLMPETLGMTAPRLDLPANPIAPDWSLSITAAETGDGFWASRDPLSNPLIGATCTIRWRGGEGDDWTASVWRLDNITRTPGDCVLSFVSPLRRLLVAPLLEQPSVELAADLSADATSATTDPTPTPDGYYCLGDELVRVSSDALTRGVAGTTAQAHEKGASFNPAYYYDGENPFDVVKDVLETAGGGEYIDDTSWDLERDTYAETSVVSGVECEPREVGAFVREMMGSAQTILHFDPFANDGGGRIRMVSLSPWATTSATLTPDNIDDGSRPRARRLRGKQITRVTLDGARRNWLDESTTQLRVGEIDGDAEIEYDLKREFKMSPSWLNGDIDVVQTEAQFAARSLVGRYRDPPMLVEGLRVSQGMDISLGDVVNLEYGRLFKTADGQDRTVATQVIGAQPSPSEGKTNLTLIRYRVRTGIIEDIVIDEDTLNFNVFEYFLRPTQAIDITITVRSNVVVGSAAATLPAFTTGSLPTGSAIELVIESGARVVGRGGLGSVPASGSIAAIASVDGGDAIKVASGALTITNNGVIGGGGGGGAGASSTGQYTTGNIISGIRSFVQGGAGAGYTRSPARVATRQARFLTPFPIAFGQADEGGLDTGETPATIHRVTSINPREVSVNPVLRAGKGGDLGEDGEDASATIFTLAAAPSGVARVFGSPSDAGAAIVVSSGASVVYATRGDIAGDAPE